VPASVLYMSMSLDGYIAGPNDDPGNPGGDGFLRLHNWFVAVVVAPIVIISPSRVRQCVVDVFRDV
jgi:hypothetical protein